MNDSVEFISKLRVGDKVFSSSFSHHGIRYTIGTVESIDAHLITIKYSDGSPIKFNKSNGRHSVFKSRIYEYSPENARAVALSEKRRVLKSVDWNYIPPKLCADIYKMVSGHIDKR